MKEMMGAKSPSALWAAKISRRGLLCAAVFAGVCVADGLLARRCGRWFRQGLGGQRR